MRGFLILSIVAVAAAGKLGYDYRPSSGGGLGLGSSLGGVGISSGGGIGSSSGSSHSGLGLSSGLVGSRLGGGLSSNGGLLSGSGSHGHGVLTAPAPVVTEYNKEFYFHSAPEEEIHDSGASQRITSTLKKNLRVVFIKAPENNGLTNAALQIARQATEDKTAIYVLTKQNDVSDLTEQLQQIQEIRSQKPEVRFIKYRTQQDAINAQRAIQAQYDALGGSSRSSDEGVAPVLNYASSSPVGSHLGSGSVSELSSAGSLPSGSVSLPAPSGSYLAPKNSYLPPVVF